MDDLNVIFCLKYENCPTEKKKLLTQGSFYHRPGKRQVIIQTGIACSNIDEDKVGKMYSMFITSQVIFSEIFQIY